MKCINFLDPDPLHIPGLLFCEQSVESLNSSSKKQIQRKKNPTTKQSKICAVTPIAQTQQEESQKGNSGESSWQHFNMWHNVKAFCFTT